MAHKPFRKFILVLLTVLFAPFFGRADEPIKTGGASPAIPAGGRELVSNASVEELKGGVPVGYTWNGTAAKMEALAKVEIVADAHTGSNAICVTRLNDGGKYSLYPPFEKIAPSDIPRYYQISVWMKGEAAGSLAAQIQCTDSKWGKAYDSVFDVYAGWKQYLLPVQVNPGDDVAHLRINFLDALIGDKLFMDDFSMREIGLEEFTQIAALQKKMTHITWAAVTLPPKEGIGCNLLRNSSFQNGLEHWGLGNTMSGLPRNERVQCDETERFQGLSTLRFNPWPRWYDSGAHLQSPPIPMRKGQAYTMSAYMKSNKPDVDAGLELRYNPSKASAAGTSIKLTQEWKRYSFSFEVGECPTGTGIAMIKARGGFLKNDNYNDQTVWLAGVQLEEGGLSDYAPAPGVEITGSTPFADSLFVEGAPITLVTQITIPDTIKPKTSSHWSLEYAFKDIFGNIVATRSFVIKPGDKKSIKHIYVWNTKLLGGYCAEMTLKEGETVLAQGINPFAILPQMPADIQKKNKLFGVNTASADSLFKISKRVGAGSIRFHDDFYFRWLMLKQDKNTPYWYEPNKEAVVQAMKSEGMHILANLELGTLWASTAPEGIQGYPRIHYLPVLADWRTFVQDQTVHFKNLVDAWEVWNEPYLTGFWQGTAPEYVSMLEASYQEVKKVDPSIPIVGICGPHTYHSHGWNEKCLEAGALKFMDVYSFHDYVNLSSGACVDWIKIDAGMKQKRIEAGGGGRSSSMEHRMRMRRRPRFLV